MPLVLLLVHWDPSDSFFDGWNKVFYLLGPRFVAFLLLSSGAPSYKLYSKLSIAIFIEILCLTFVSWMFGRSIMYIFSFYNFRFLETIFNFGVSMALLSLPIGIEQ